MKSFQIGKIHCPKCKVLLDGATNTQGEIGPRGGDLTICVYCSTLLKFDDNIQLVIMSDEEFNKLPENDKKHLNKIINHININKPN